MSQSVRRIIAIGVVAVATLVAGSPVRAQSGGYAAASLARPVTLTVSGGAYIYDYLSDNSFPFGALRVARDFGRFFVVEGSAQVARLSSVMRTAPDAATFSSRTFPQTTFDGTVQLQVPVWVFAPYAGIGAGYYHLSGVRTVASENGLSRVGLVGIRVAVAPRVLLRGELRGRSDQHVNGKANDFEFSGGIGVRF
jgi:hypothetical protein